MSILNLLPRFKVVEINRSTGLVSGHVLSQFPAAAAFPTYNSGGKFIENGYIVQLNKDNEIAVHAGGTLQPFVLYTEELNTFLDTLDSFATPLEAGEFYPRAVALYVGDAFTTNNYTGTETDAKYAKVVTGVLTLQATADSNTMFTAELSTLPNGTKAFKFVYVGKGVNA